MLRFFGEVMWYLYVVSDAHGCLYTGITVDVERRMKMHRSGQGSTYLRSRGVGEVQKVWTFETHREAAGYEYRFKELSRKRKLAMIGLTEDQLRAKLRPLYPERPRGKMVHD